MAWWRSKWVETGDAGTKRQRGERLIRVDQSNYLTRVVKEERVDLSKTKKRKVK